MDRPVLGRLPEVLEDGGDVDAVRQLVVVARLLDIAIQEEEGGGEVLLRGGGGEEEGGVRAGDGPIVAAGVETVLDNMKKLV